MKKILRFTLQSIKDKYKPTIDHPENITHCVEDFVQCSGLSDNALGEHLLKTDLVPCEEDLEEAISEFSSFGSIVDNYICMLQVLTEDYGFFEYHE